MPCPCCNPQPCVITVEGTAVNLNAVDEADALLVEWTHAGRTLQTLPSKQTLVYWYGTFESALDEWQEVYGLYEESRQLQNWWIVAGFNPSIISYWDPPACNRWTVEVLSSTVCRISGCVQTYYDLGTLDTGVRPYQAGDYQIRALWKWTCDFVSGVQQAVQYELLDGYRYDWDTTTNDFVLDADGDVGSAPVVTITIAP